MVTHANDNPSTYQTKSWFITVLKLPKSLTKNI